MSLPSEAEWEKAARGTDGRRYPWGDRFDSDLANTGEGEVDDVSAVGCFPGGASPGGCEEMSGNVWEWTRSILKDYPYVKEDGREDIKELSKVLRVVRGGSCFYDSRLARCASRFRNEPEFRFDDIGFRVVVLPFSSGL